MHGDLSLISINAAAFNIETMMETHVRCQPSFRYATSFRSPTKSYTSLITSRTSILQPLDSQPFTANLCAADFMGFSEQILERRISLPRFGEQPP